MRVVKDDDVDRRQVYRQRCHSRALLIARNFGRRQAGYAKSGLEKEESASERIKKRLEQAPVERSKASYLFQYVNVISGGYSVGVPPLPIPNREVKPDRADGTAQAGE